MNWLWGLLAVLFVLDALRLRRRVSAFKAAAPASTEFGSSEYRLIVGLGVVVDDATARAAAAHARAHGLAVLDLVPSDLPALSAMGLAWTIDPARYRADPFGRGYTAGHALLATADVLERADATNVIPSDPAAFVRLAAKLKCYACTSMEQVIAPGLRAVREDPDRRRAVLREMRGSGEPLRLLVVEPLLIAAMAVAAMRAPWWGILALLAYHSQPLIALWGQRLRPPYLLLTALWRSPLELGTWARTLLGGWQPPPELDPVDLRRPEYARLVAGGLDRFFEPRRETCPLCGSGDLRRQVSMPDLHQGKPGRFRLERCGGCGHIFQNPGLSIAGIDYYYRDFYDGLGTKTLEGLFSLNTHGYIARARMLQDRREPRRWLDVGAGYGHFCCAARQVWPKTAFDGLDFSVAITEATRRGWVDSGYRGLFPELAPGLAGTYDVVSMFHYLEHTRDPQAELTAARQALRPDGHLLIEMPDPESPMGRLLGRFWLPWFQPQHLHLLSVGNLERLLQRHGFEPVVWHRGEAHQRFDFLAAVVLLLRFLARFPNTPWGRPPRRLDWVRFFLMWTLGAPLVPLGWALDVVLLPVFRRPGLSNCYRVLAKRSGGDGSS